MNPSTRACLPLTLLFLFGLLAGCSGNPTGPTPSPLSARFWLSKSRLGAGQTMFAAGDSIYFNYVIVNHGDSAVHWFKADLSPVGIFYARTGGDTVLNSEGPAAQAAIHDNLAPNDSLIAAWKGVGQQGDIPIGDYVAIVSPRVGFAGLPHLTVDSLSFSVR
jgi:hypothetical protein